MLSLCISTDCFQSLNNMLEGKPSPTFLLFEHFFLLIRSCRYFSTSNSEISLSRLKKPWNRSASIQHTIQMNCLQPQKTALQDFLFLRHPLKNFQQHSTSPRFFVLVSPFGKFQQHSTDIGIQILFWPGTLDMKSQYF